MSMMEISLYVIINKSDMTISHDSVLGHEWIILIYRPSDVEA